MSPKQIASFWMQVKKTPRCWLWQGKVTPLGYGGSVRWGTSSRRAHQIAYLLLVGSVPKGLELDHTCRNKKCVNPKHLEPVTHRVNVLRGHAPSAKYAQRNKCIRGHAFSKLNIRYRNNARICRLCENERSSERRKTKNEIVRAYHRSYYAANREKLLRRMRERRAS
jgi:hypothetical protein